MKMKMIEYLIEFAPYRPGCYSTKERVQGYALDAGITEADGTLVRICVREKGAGEWWADKWIADHYDTGRCFGVISESRAECAEAAVARVRQAVSDGRYHAALVKVGYRRK